MQIHPLSPMRAAPTCLSPVDIWQTLLTHLFNQHYGLVLNDTPFGNEGSFRSILTPVSHCVTRST